MQILKLTTPHYIAQKRIISVLFIKEILAMYFQIQIISSFNCTKKFNVR